jgi:flagellar protein FlaG
MAGFRQKHARGLTICVVWDPMTASPSLHSPKVSTLASIMSLPAQPNVKLTNDPDYREAYANSVQMRVNVWDFFMVFGTLQQQTESHVEIRNFQGVYLSPQQAKALLGLLQQNVSGYESAFGEIKLDPRLNPAGPVH